MKNIALRTPQSFVKRIEGEMVVVTEDKAKTKWCPFVRIMDGAGLVETTMNRVGSQKHPNCIASDCMAWRWAGPSDARGSREGAFAVGYCGLAGKTEFE